MDERPMSYGAAVSWAAAAVALLFLVTRVLVALRPAVRTDIVSLGGVEALVFVLCSFGVLSVYSAGRGARQAFGLRPTHPALAVFGLALGITLQLPAQSLEQLVTHYFPLSAPELLERSLLFSGGSVGHVVALLLAVGCVGPLVEELFFRGALFGGLRRGQSVAGAVVVSSVAFALSHLDFRQWLPLLVVAFALGYLRAVGGSLLPCLALHVGFNTVTIIGILTGVSTVTRPMHIGPPLAIAGWGATLALLYAVQVVASRSPEAEQARLEDAA